MAPFPFFVYGGLVLLVYALIGAFMWSVAVSLRRMARAFERMANHRDLQREANRHEPKVVEVDSQWPVNP